MTRDVDDVLPARLRFVRHTDGEALSIVNFNDGTLMKKPGVLPVLPMKNGWVPGTWFTIDSKKIGALVFHQHWVNLRGGGLWEWYTGYVLILRKKL